MRVRTWCEVSQWRRGRGGAIWEEAEKVEQRGCQAARGGACVQECVGQKPNMTKNFNHFLCRFAGVCSALKVMGFGGTLGPL